MSVEKMENKLEALVSMGPTKWEADAKWRAENKEWLKNSQAIAIRINRALREKNISQKTLAELMGVTPQQVSKIVKGRENLTLQTIGKLERALGISLMSIPQHVKGASILSESSFKSTVQRIRAYHDIKKQLLLLEDASRMIAFNTLAASAAKFLKTTQQSIIKKPFSNMIEEYMPVPVEAKIIKLCA